MAVCSETGFKIVSEYDQEIPQSQTADNPEAREEEPPNHQETPGRQTKQQPTPHPHQDDRNTRTDTKQRTTKHRTITDSHNGSNNKQKANNNRTTAPEGTVAQATVGGGGGGGAYWYSTSFAFLHCLKIINYLFNKK